MRRTLIVTVSLFVLGALGWAAWRYLQQERPALAEWVEQGVEQAPQRVRDALTPTPSTPPAAPDDAKGEIGLEHPIATDPYTALPRLDASDAGISGELASVVGAAPLARHVETDGLIRRLVAAIDNLPGGRLSMKQRPIKAVPGDFAVTGEDASLQIDAANQARYAPLVTLIEAIDPASLAAVYRRYYPLFQQAYQELGYPDAYFNDRLVTVIDQLLAVKPIDGPIRLARPNVLYLFADPALEARPPGEKILLRMGSDNAARVQAVLRRWRAEIVRP